MTTLRAAALGAALFAGGLTQASAADLYGGSIKDGYIPHAPVTYSPSWYVRGDVGFASYDRPTMIEDDVFDLTRTSIHRQWTGGAGVGYYFSKSVRGDLTWDHRFETDARGSLNNYTATPFPGERSFGLKSDVFLANVYYDFDLRSRLTPYVGIGLGVTHNTTTSGSVPDQCGCDFTNVSIAGASQWSVAAALMAGFSFAVRDRLHIDAGYRGMYLGEAHTGLITGTINASTTQDPAQSGDPVVKDLWAHEFRVGLRYDIR